MLNTAKAKEIHTITPTPAFVGRIVDSIVIALSLYLATIMLKEDWGKFHPFYALTGVLMMQISAELFHLYSHWNINATIKLTVQAITVWLTSCLFMLVFSVIFHKGFIELDLTLAVFWVVSACVLLFVSRVIFNFGIKLLRRYGYNKRKVVIAGSGPLASYAVEQIKNNPWIDYEIIGIYDDRSGVKFSLESLINKRSPESIDSYDADEIVTSGSFGDMVEHARKNEFDIVFIALPMKAEHKIKEITRMLAKTTVATYVVPDFYSITTHYTQISNINGMPIVSIYENPASGLRGFVKRVEDIILSILFIIAFSIPMTAIALAVKLTSPGPVLFKQNRYGLDGKPFKVWKFRSMRVMENDKVVKQATRGDPRVTKVGAFIRRYSLDELPQFFNVFFGNMSIVGPRPHAASHNEEYRDIIHGYMLRHKIKPGITGWAQVNGYRGETDTLEKMQNRVTYDIDYIKRWSVFFDIKILLMTIFKGFTGTNAY